MKRLFLAAILLPGLAIVNANATPQSHTVQLTAHVDEFCNLGTPTSSGTGFSNVGASSSIFTVAINGLLAQATHGSLMFDGAMCNAPSHLTISRNGLKNPGITGGDFDTEIPYTLEAIWGGLDYILHPHEVPSPQAVGPIIGSLTLDISVPAGGNPLARGSYQDTLVLTVTPDV